jgi:hypothetical protein
MKGLSLTRHNVKLMVAARQDDASVASEGLDKGRGDAVVMAAVVEEPDSAMATVAVCENA